MYVYLDLFHIDLFLNSLMLNLHVALIIPNDCFFKPFHSNKLFHEIIVGQNCGISFNHTIRKCCRFTQHWFLVRTAPGIELIPRVFSLPLQVLIQWMCRCVQYNYGGTSCFFLVKHCLCFVCRGGRTLHFVVYFYWLSYVSSPELNHCCLGERETLFPPKTRGLIVHWCNMQQWEECL